MYEAIEILTQERAPKGVSQAHIDIQQFLKHWNQDYTKRIDEIALFNPDKNARLSVCQKSYFIRAFYHVRGHFNDFLWYMGNHAPDEFSKNAFIGNIREEFGGKLHSHEQLYYRFAEFFDVDIKQEIIEKATYEPYIRQFNHGHLKWLHENDWPRNFAAFSAYEFLDNIDYKRLSSLALNMGCSKRSMGFFIVHVHAEHFEPLYKSLIGLWQQSPETIREGFDFICNHQINMWKTLSDRVFEHA